MRFFFACLPFILVCLLIFGWRFVHDALACGCNPGWPVSLWETVIIWILIVALGLIAAWGFDE